MKYYITMRNADGTHYLGHDCWGCYYERILMNKRSAKRVVTELRQSKSYQNGDYGLWNLKIKEERK
jgi:hypothetical protein